MHGGKTPRGPDSPHWKDGSGNGGAAAKELPRLDELYAQAFGDPELMQFRHDVALYEALRRQITNRLKLNRPVSKAAQDRLVDLGEAIRRSKEAELKRIQVLQNMVPLEQHRKALAATGAIVSEVLQERLALVHQALAEGKDIAGLLDGAAWTQEMARRYRIAALRTPAIIDVTGEE